MWISLAIRERAAATGISGRFVTFEIDPGRAALARETYKTSGVSDIVSLIEGDAMITVPEFFKSIQLPEAALGKLPDDPFLAFAFLDTEKRDYGFFYDLIVPRLVQGGILAADNVISHAGDLGDFLSAADADKRVDSLVVPVGSGIIVCRKCA